MELKAANEIGYQIGVESTAGKVHVLTFELEFDITRARERMTLTRSDSGAMLLWKLETNDEVDIQHAGLATKV